MTLRIRINSLIQEHKQQSFSSEHNDKGKCLSLYISKPKKQLSYQLPFHLKNQRTQRQILSVSKDAQLLFYIDNKPNLSIKVSASMFIEKIQNSPSHNEEKYPYNNQIILLSFNESKSIILDVTLKYNKFKNISGELWSTVKWVCPHLQKKERKVKQKQDQKVKKGRQRWNEVMSSQRSSKISLSQKQMEEENTFIEDEDTKDHTTHNKEQNQDKKSEKEEQTTQIIKISQDLVEKQKIEGQKPIQKERMKFFKGPCQRKNLFSCLDVSINEQEIVWVEPRYI